MSEHWLLCNADEKGDDAMAQSSGVDVQHPANAGILAYLGQAQGRKKAPWSPGMPLPQSSPQNHPDPYYGLGTHPDLVARLWDELTPDLPESCQWIVQSRPVLVHPTSGIIFGYAEGTHAYALRVPPGVHQKALQLGASTIHTYPDHIFDLANFGPAWLFGHWLREEPRWCVSAYAFAGEGQR
jgi:hypothetical protein